MLFDLLRDNLGLFTAKNRLVDSGEGSGSKSDDGIKSVSTRSCSTTGTGPAYDEVECIEVLWESPPKAERKIKRVIAPIGEDADSDERGLPVLNKRGSRNLPTNSWYYSSNHIMVNNERRKNFVHALTRKHELDSVAKWHAENMAGKDRLHHAVPEELQEKVGRPCRVIGKNVFRGESVRAIHNEMMKSPSDVKNMLDRRYVQFGMATAKGKGGDLFLCQVFIG